MIRWLSLATFSNSFPLTPAMKPRLISCLVCAILPLISSSPAHADLIGFYSFDDETNPYVDDSGQGNDLETTTSEPVFTPDGGFTGGGMVFNGSQWLISPLEIFWGEGSMPEVTMGAWVKTSTLSPGLRKIIGCDDGGYDRVLGLDTRQPTGFGYMAFLGTGVMGGGPAPVSTEQWTFVAVTYDQPNNQAKLYVGLDAAAVTPLAVSVATTNFGGSSRGNTSIGSVDPNGAGEGWQGSIDNVFFYDEILTEQQLTAIRNGGKAAILGTGGGDPDLSIVAAPDLRGLGKGPTEHTISYQIKNAGLLQSLNISEVTLSGVDSTYYAVVDFPATLAPGAEGAITFKLTPQGQVGSFSASAAVVSNDAENATTVLDLSTTILGTSLLAVYTFDDPENPLKDDSGQGRTLQTVAGAEPVYDAAGGLSGGAYTFDGSQRLVSPINIRSDVAPYLTMGAWVKPSNVDPGGYFKIMGNDAGWSRVLGLDPRGDHGWRYLAFTGSGVLNEPTAAPVNTDDWNFVAVSYAQPINEMAVYVDVEAASSPGAFVSATGLATINSGTTMTSIGSLGPATAGEGWQGQIDAVFFIKGKLDEAAVKALRDGGPPALQALQPDPVLASPDSSVFEGDPQLGARTVTVTLRNLGAAQPLNVISMTLAGPQAANFTLSPLSASTIAPGGTATFEVTFNPGDSGGIFEAWVDVLSTDQVGRHRRIDLKVDAAFPSLKSALLAFYPFDNEENPLKDESGKGRDLQYVEGAEPEFVLGGGFENSAFVFGGTQRMISPVNIHPSATPRLTMGAWVRTDSLDEGRRKIMGADGVWSRVIGVDERGVEGFSYTGFFGNGVISEVNAFPDDVEDWTFIAAVYDQPAGQMTLYVDLHTADGAEDMIVVERNTVFGDHQTTTSVGSLRPDNNSEGWIGSLDNVFFYQTALTPAQIRAVREGGAAVILADNPPQPAADFAIISVERGADVKLTWESLAGRTYVIQSSTSLAAGQWEDIATVEAEATTTTYSDTDATRLARPVGFYRVQLKP